MTTYAQQAYRSATAAGATQIQAQILVLDNICLQLGRAAAAVGRSDILARCKASNEVLHLLGHLESWAPLFGDPLLADTSIALYGYCRTQLLAAQGSAEPQPFYGLAELLAGLSEAWRKKEALLLGVQESHPIPAIPPQDTSEYGKPGRTWHG